MARLYEVYVQLYVAHDCTELTIVHELNPIPWVHFMRKVLHLDLDGTFAV